MAASKAQKEFYRLNDLGQEIHAVLDTKLASVDRAALAQNLLRACQ